MQFQQIDFRRVIRASGGQQRENHGGQVGKLGNGNEVDFRRAVEAEGECACPQPLGDQVGIAAGDMPGIGVG